MEDLNKSIKILKNGKKVNLKLKELTEKIYLKRQE